MSIKAFIFDLDGVITDTANYHFLAWKRLADEIGVSFDRERNELLRGVSRRQSLLILLDGKPATEEELETWMRVKNEYYVEYLTEITSSDLLPGVLEVLEFLKKHNVKMALGSASKNAKRVVERLEIGNFLDVICDGFSVVNPKPAPDLFLFAAEQVSAKPSECVVVEDAAAGIEAGIAAGMKTIGIGPSARVGKADYVFEDGFETVNFERFFESLS